MHKKNKNNIITYFIITLCETNRVLLESSQNSRENTRARSLFSGLRPATLLLYQKRDPGTAVFL